ncbi:MAG: potassium/proton antiporter [Bacteroidota bacterium]
MNVTSENILLIGSVLLLTSIVAGKTSYKFGVPTLIFFLAVGMLAGSEGIGGIYFDDPKIAQFIGVAALNFILFSGGLDTSWESVKPVLWHGVSLSTLGVFLTALTAGLFVFYITDFTIFEALLLGSIVSSTDAAAVFSILRSRSLALKHNLRPMLELESGSNDPMAYVLTIAFTGLAISPDANIAGVIPIFLQQMILGATLGFASGKVSKYVINNIKLETLGLYPVLVIGLMYFTFSITEAIEGNGFLAIYIQAVYLGNQELIHKKSIIKYFDGFAWLMQIVLFLTLGLLIYPSEIVPVIGIGLAISAFMILVARPVSVFISLLFFRLRAKSRWYVSWVGLRGAVPIVFATYPLLAGVDKAGVIFNIVFFISLTSVIIQGTSLPVIARWLKVAMPEKLKPKTELEVMMNDELKSELFEIEIPEQAPVVGKRIVDVNFPVSINITMIRRGGKYLTPSGTTTIQAHDRMSVLVRSKYDFEVMNKMLESNGAA